MLHEYRNKTVIKAEQFDGSDEVIDKYGIRMNATVTFDFGSSQFLLPTKEGFMSLDTGDWIATGINGEHWVIADDIFRQTYEIVTEQQDCPYCHHSEGIRTFTDNWNSEFATKRIVLQHSSASNEDNFFIIAPDYGQKVGVLVEFNYCPMCGRPLRGVVK